MTIEDHATRDRAFDDAKVRKWLDSSSLDEVIGDLGEPEKVTRYEPPSRWKQGDPRPPLADEDPAVNAAMGRCAISRMRGVGRSAGMPWVDSFHSSCGWCEYTVDMLLDALDWALWFSRWLVVELYVWRQAASGPGYYVTYIRSTGRSGYQQPDWARFSSMSGEDQTRVVDSVLAAAATQ